MRSKRWFWICFYVFHGIMITLISIGIIMLFIDTWKFQQEVNEFRRILH